MPALFEEGEPVHGISGILPYKESKRWTLEAAQNSEQHQQEAPVAEVPPSITFVSYFQRVQGPKY